MAMAFVMAPAKVLEINQLVEVPEASQEFPQYFLQGFPLLVPALPEAWE